MTAVSAAAPPGGCRQRASDMINIAAATAIPEESVTSGMKWYVATPTIAEIALPPITDHGCANGLEGNANTSTADAPSGATIDDSPGASGA